MRSKVSLAAGAIVLIAVAVAPRPAGADGYWGQGDSSPVTGDCDPAVATRVVTLGRQNADAWTALAMNQYPPMTQPFGKMSCIDSLLNSSLNIVFNAPSLDDILNKLEAAACNIARSYVTQAINSSLSSLSSSTSFSQAASLGQLIPGLGGISGGISIGTTNGSGGLLTINQSSGARNLAGYWGGGDPKASSYGGLFGSNSASVPATGTSSSWFSGFGLSSLFGSGK